MQTLNAFSIGGPTRENTCVVSGVVNCHSQPAGVARDKHMYCGCPLKDDHPKILLQLELLPPFNVPSLRGNCSWNSISVHSSQSLLCSRILWTGSGLLKCRFLSAGCRDSDSAGRSETLRNFCFKHWLFTFPAPPIVMHLEKHSFLSCVDCAKSSHSLDSETTRLPKDSFVDSLNKPLLCP